MPVYATPLEYQGDSLVFAVSEPEPININFDFSAADSSLTLALGTL